MDSSDQLPREDFDSLVLHPERMKDYLCKLREACANYKAKLERRVQESLSRGSERTKQLEESSKTLTQLAGQKKELKEALNNIRLEKKVLEKRTMNTIRDIEKTTAVMEIAKARRESLMLENVDLQQEIEEQYTQMKLQWGSIKRACNKFKNILDIRINLEKHELSEIVTVTFFIAENPTDKKFFVTLLYQDDCWKVKKIEPELSVEQKYQLNYVVQFSKLSEVSNVTSLLCELRQLFLKNYFENNAELITQNS